MDHYILPIFPEGSLGGSIVTTVWIGMLVSAFFNLRLGWALSGLVVPGYLVPLILEKPWSAGTIFIEAVICYLAVWILFERIMPLFKWGNVFGRDRFFALLLMSVIVRLVSDSIILPWIGEVVTTRSQIAFDYQSNLHSFGLIVIALIANQFWKPGLIRGLAPVLIPVLVTLVIIRYGLMEYTNFSISNLSYAYEDMAVSMLASPKAYIILLTSAVFASRMNLRYGWEFSGILIPSLIALQWYQPIKVAATFGEAFIVYRLSILILESRLFGRTSVEGARKLLLFSTVSYGYKFALAYCILMIAPDLKVSDYYGFGYLLPTMLAMKMHEEEAPARVFRATLQTSLSAVAVASIVGYTLTLLPVKLEDESLLETQNRDDNTLFDADVSEFVRHEKMLLYASRIQQLDSDPSPALRQAFFKGISLLLAREGDAGTGVREAARRWLREANYDVHEAGSRYLYLVEREPRRGWGAYIIDTLSTDGIAVEVPAPLDELNAAETSAWIFLQLNARTLAIAGSNVNSNSTGAVDALHNERSIYQIFHEAVASQGVLQVRTRTPERIHFDELLVNEEVVGTNEISTAVLVDSRIPSELNLALLNRVVGDFTVIWGSSSFSNLQRESSENGFVELVLGERASHKALAKQLSAVYPLDIQIFEQRIDGYFQDWILDGKNNIAQRGSNNYVGPKLENLLFLDEEVLTPLMRLIRTEYTSNRWSEVGLEELRTLAASANLMGYELIRYRHKSSSQDYVILKEHKNSGSLRYWGTYVFRLGDSSDYVIQVPRPLYEVNTLEYGVHLFERMDAVALYIGGANPEANFDGSADIVKRYNKENLFSLANQVLMREWKDRPLMAVQTRAFGLRPGNELSKSDALLAFDNGARDERTATAMALNLINVLRDDGLLTEFVNGSVETTGYEVGNGAHSLYLSASENKEFALLWLSPFVRAEFRQQTENRLEAMRFAAMGLTTVEEVLYEYAVKIPTWGNSATVPTELRDNILHYVEQSDVILLQGLVEGWPDYRFMRVIDVNSKQSFLIVQDSLNALVLVVNLTRPLPDRSLVLQRSITNLQESIYSFVESGTMWLEIEGEV